MTKLAPEWVRTSDPVIRRPARYRWTTAPAALFGRNPNNGIYWATAGGGFFWVEVVLLKSCIIDHEKVILINIQHFFSSHIAAGKGVMVIVVIALPTCMTTQGL